MGRGRGLFIYGCDKDDNGGGGEDSKTWRLAVISDSIFSKGIQSSASLFDDDGMGEEGEDEPEDDPTMPAANTEQVGDLAKKILMRGGDFLFA